MHIFWCKNHISNCNRCWDTAFLWFFENWWKRQNFKGYVRGGQRALKLKFLGLLFVLWPTPTIGTALIKIFRINTPPLTLGSVVIASKKNRGHHAFRGDISGTIMQCWVNEKLPERGHFSHNYGLTKKIDCWYFAHIMPTESWNS